MQKPLNPIILYCCLALACKNPASNAGSTDSLKRAATPDTSTIARATATSTDALADSSAARHEKDYTITLKNGVLRVKYKSTGKVDILDLKGRFETEEPPQFKDLTDSNWISPLLIQVYVTGWDIYTQNFFVGYKKGRLKELFYLYGTEENGTELHRKDAHTLACHVTGRDEVVEDLQEYPMDIDLRTMEVNSVSVLHQYIGFQTTALEPIIAHRVVNGVITNALVNIKAGDTLRVDTLYRDRKKVRLLIRDSIRVEIQVETGKKKLQHNAAG
jgi:hypothetical protein